MQVTNKVLPNEEQIKGFLEKPEFGSISMVNLLKFKDKAIYADGRDTNLSGDEAYQLYAELGEVIIPEGLVGSQESKAMSFLESMCQIIRDVELHRPWIR